MKTTLAIALILLAISLYFNINFYSEQQTFKSKEDDFEQQRRENKQQLQEQSRERMVLVDSIADLNESSNKLLQLIEENKKELKQIKNRYKEVKPSELSELMEQRANGEH